MDGLRAHAAFSEHASDEASDAAFEDGATVDAAQALLRDIGHG
jgi:hypothetical protein